LDALPRDVEIEHEARVRCTVTQIFTSADYKTVTEFAVSPAPANAVNAMFRFITGDFRIQSWRLNKNWSINITARTVTTSMYDLTVGPKPLDVAPAPLPALFYPIPFGPAWAPYQIQTRADDALFPGEWAFDTSQSYAQMADGSMLANLVVARKLPANTFSPGVGVPVAGTVAVNATGGSLVGGTTIRLTLCALDTNGLPSVPMRASALNRFVGPVRRVCGREEVFDQYSRRRERSSCPAGELDGKSEEKI
jgi:hypothetical protein